MLLIKNFIVLFIVVEIVLSQLDTSTNKNFIRKGIQYVSLNQSIESPTYQTSGNYNQSGMPTHEPSHAPTSLSTVTAMPSHIPTYFNFTINEVLTNVYFIGCYNDGGNGGIRVFEKQFLGVT